MNILFASSELQPYSKTGGLADSVRSLSVALTHAGENVVVVTPFYKMKTNTEIFLIDKTDISYNITVGTEKVLCEVYKSEIPGTNVTTYLLYSSKYFDRKEIYMENGVGYSDNDERFIFFSLAVIELTKRISIDIDIIHANDWQTALIPVYLKNNFKDDEKLNKIKSILTIHNLSFQGLYPVSSMAKANIDINLFYSGSIEFWGRMNFMKGGLVFADYITTLSPKYAEEIQTFENSFGLEGLLQYRSGDLQGIVNGVDSSIWNPETDVNIYNQYDIDSLDEKEANKLELQKELGLPVDKDIPLIGIVARITEQKGMSLIVESFDYFESTNIQLVVLGTGNPEIEEKIIEFAENHKNSVCARIDFDEKLAHKIDAAADILLMPAKFEPSGLGVKFSLIYGTVPVVRNVGALFDSVIDYRKENGTGFLFEEYNKDEMIATLEKAIDIYKNQRDLWRKLQMNCMSSDFSWSKSARKYVDLYSNIVNKNI